MKFNEMINQVIQGECLEVMKHIPDKSIDITVTSPPYDNLRDYDGYSFNFESVAEELYRITKEGGVVVWVVGDATVNGSETGTSFRQALYFKEIGFNLHDTMIYHKLSFVPLTHNRYEQAFEYMFVFSKNKPNTVNHIKIATITGGRIENPNNWKNINEKKGAIRIRNEVIKRNYKRIRTNVWGYSVGNNEKTEHPAPFPNKLAADHIISWSNEGDLVLDPMSGSGTTCKMAKKLNRRFIGIDVSDKYCQIARDRLANETDPLF
jgi:DNA modification methylase